MFEVTLKQSYKLSRIIKMNLFQCCLWQPYIQRRNSYHHNDVAYAIRRYDEDVSHEHF